MWGRFSLSCSLFLACARAPLASASRINPKTHARGAATKEWSLKTHYRTLQIPHFPFACSFLLRHCDSHTVSRPIRPIDSRPTDRTDHSIILQSAIHDPVGADLRGPDGLVENHLTARPVGVVNYLRLCLELLSFRCRYRNIRNYVTWLFFISLIRHFRHSGRERDRSY